MFGEQRLGMDWSSMVSLINQASGHCESSAMGYDVSMVDESNERCLPLATTTSKNVLLEHELCYDRVWQLLGIPPAPIQIMFNISKDYSRHDWYTWPFFPQSGTLRADSSSWGTLGPPRLSKEQSASEVQTGEKSSENSPPNSWAVVASQEQANLHHILNLVVGQLVCAHAKSPSARGSQYVHPY